MLTQFEGVPSDSFRGMDFLKVNFTELNHRFSKVKWGDLFDSCDLEEVPVFFTFIMLQICQDLVPIRRLKG